MKKARTAAAFAVTIMITLAGISSYAADKTGEVLFNQHCEPCHPAGGNVLTPRKTLHKKDLKANEVKTSDDIVNIMRNPGPGMTKFEAKMISDKDARVIADYIMKSFK